MAVVAASSRVIQRGFRVVYQVIQVDKKN